MRFAMRTTNTTAAMTVAVLRGDRARARWMSAAARANLAAGPARATGPMSSIPSTSRSSGRSWTRIPRDARRACCAACVARVLIGTPTTAPGAGSRRPIAHQPPSAAGPSTASTPGSARASRAPVSEAAVTCGVSMPISSAGPPVSTKAAAIRSSRPSPRCPSTRKPGGSHAPGSPSRANTCSRAGVLRATSSVSINAASASDAASPCESGGVRRVFARPGAGAFARTMRLAERRILDRAHRSTLARSASARAVPLIVPVTLLVPVRARYVTGTSATRQSAAAARITISNGHPNRRSTIPSRSSPSRSSGAHRPAIADLETGTAPDLPRDGPVPQTGVHRPGAGFRTPLAQHQVLDPGGHRLGDPRKLSWVEGRVTVHEADDVGRRRLEAGLARGAEARPRLTHHLGAQRGRTFGRTVGRPVVDHDRVVTERHPLQHPRDRCELVQRG